jgi:hypothetical protein
MRKHSLILAASVAAISGLVAVGSAAAQPGSFTQTCQAVQSQGYTVTTHVITRSSGAPTPRPGSYSIGTAPTDSYHVSPLRAYGYSGHDRIFLDSFPLEPVTGKRTCSVEMKIKGNSGSVVNNDAIVLMLPTGPGKLFTTGGGWANHYRVWSTTLTDNLGNWSFTNPAIPVMKKDNSNAPLSAALLTTAAGVNAFDVYIQDDSTVSQIKVTYRVY